MDSTQFIFAPAVNWFVLGAIAIAVFGYVYFSYRRLKRVLSPSLALAFIILKLLVVLMLVFCLIQPVASLERRLSGQGVIAVLVDTSGSMDVKDSLGGRSRIEAAQALLLDDGRLLHNLSSDYTVRLYRFDEKLSPLEEDDLPEVNKDLRPQTALIGALAQMGKEGDFGALSGIVVISDGRDNAASSDWNSVKSLGVPIYTVGAGTDFARQAGPPNIAILSVDAPQMAYLNNALQLAVSIGAFNVPEGSGFAKLTITLDGKEITARDFRIPGSGSVGRIAAEFTPDRIGFLKYSLDVTPMSGETILTDNHRDLYVDVREPRLRVLYIEGLLRPEYGFICRTLNTDPDIKLTSMVRTRKDSFYLQGESVKIDLSKGLPDKPEDFNEFDVIILGDIAASAFREYQVKGLADWVEKGRAVLALGGYNALQFGGWRDTPLAPVLPVNMNPTDKQVDKPITVEVTAVGKTHPIFKGIDEFESAAMKGGKGRLGGCTGSAGAKSGASVLAIGRGEDNSTNTICAVQKFGKGRSAILSADTTGKANQELSGLGFASPYQKLWGQLIRWLAGFDDTRKEKDIYLKMKMDSRFCESGKSLKVETEISDPNRKLGADFSVTLSLVTPNGVEQKITSTFDKKTLTGSGEGKPDTTGLFKFVGILTGAGGAEIDRTEYPFLVGQPWLENGNLSLDEAALKSIARNTGGQYYNIASAARLPNDIAAKTGKGVERVTLSMWNNPFIFFLLVALLCSEWWLRRRNQLL
ncbi:MAG: glutamine amidotransferase [Candidatus Brocadiia bacterium]